MYSLCRRCRCHLRQVPAAVRWLHLLQQDTSSLDMSPLVVGEEVTSLSVGVGFSVAYAPRAGSSLWVFGQLPQPTGVCGYWFHRLQLPQGDEVAEASVGGRHAAIVSTRGDAYRLNVDCFTEVPNTVTPSTTATPTHNMATPSTTTRPTHNIATPPKIMFQLQRIPFPTAITKVACGLNHTLFLTADGRVFAEGWSSDGQTGLGHYGCVSEPHPVVGAAGRDGGVCSIHTCGDASFAIGAGGRVYGWGNNEYGQLATATADKKQVHTPAEVDCSGLDGEVVSIAAGGAFTAFQTVTGSVYCAGYGIGEGSATETVDPTHLSQLWRLHPPNTAYTRTLGIHSGLHYLAIEVQGSDKYVLLWGRYPGSTRPSIKSPSKLSLGLPISSLTSIGYGHEQLLALCTRVEPYTPTADHQ